MTSESRTRTLYYSMVLHHLQNPNFHKYQINGNNVMAKKASHSIELRVQIVTLVLIANLKSQDVAVYLDPSNSTVYNVLQRAKERGFDPTTNRRIERYLSCR